MTYLHNKDLCTELIISKAQGKLTEQAILILTILCKINIRKLKIPSKDDKLVILPPKKSSSSVLEHC